MKTFKHLIQDESGVTAIEYGLIAALIGVAGILAMQFVGNELRETFNYTAEQLQDGRTTGGG